MAIINEKYYIYLGERLIAQEERIDACALRLVLAKRDAEKEGHRNPRFRVRRQVSYVWKLWSDMLELSDHLKQELDRELWNYGEHVSYE